MSEHLGIAGARECADFIDEALPHTPGIGPNARALAKWSINRA